MIYKCPGFLSKKGFEIGDVKTGVHDYIATYRVGYWKKEECLACEYLPLCYGGCRYMTYNRTGAIGSIDCKKAYFTTSLERLVKMDMEYNGHKTTGDAAEKKAAS